MIDIVIATQGYRYEWFSKAVLPNIIESIKNNRDKIGNIYLIPNNLENHTIADYERMVGSNPLIKIIPGKDEYGCFNKFIPYYTTVGYNNATIHCDDDLIVSESLMSSYLKAAETYPNLVIGSGKCSYYEWGGKIVTTNRVAPLVTDCITNLVWLNHGLIYFPAGCFKNSFVVDWDVLKSNKFNKLYDESIVQLHLLINGISSYIINDTFNLGIDQLPYISAMNAMVDTNRSLTLNRSRNREEWVQFNELVNGEYYDIINNNFEKAKFICVVNNTNAMAFKLMRNRISKLFKKEIEVAPFLPNTISYSWVYFINNNDDVA